jgi:hypothetical protein
LLEHEVNMGVIIAIAHNIGVMPLLFMSILCVVYDILGWFVCAKIVK